MLSNTVLMFCNFCDIEAAEIFDRIDCLVVV